MLVMGRLNATLVSLLILPDATLNHFFNVFFIVYFMWKLVAAEPGLSGCWLNQIG
jgi:hypothetical protein